MPECDFNKAALQLYWNRTSAWVLHRNIFEVCSAFFNIMNEMVDTSSNFLTSPVYQLAQMEAGWQPFSVINSLNGKFVII